MTQGQLATDFINWGINAAFPVAILFPFFIRPVWKWTESAWGWTTIIFDVIAALAIMPTWLHRVFGIDPRALPFEWLEAACIWAVPVVIIWRTWVIYQVQRHGE